MNISQRGTGNSNLLKNIQQASKQVTQQMGLSEAMRIFPKPPEIDESKLGAAASLGLNQKASIPAQQQQKLNEMFGSTDSNLVSGNTTVASGAVKFDFMKSASQRLMDSIDSLEYTKEYVSAIQAMFSLYAIGSLDDTVLDRVSRSDMREIKSILKEFNNILSNY